MPRWDISLLCRLLGRGKEGKKEGQAERNVKCRKTFSVSPFGQQGGRERARSEPVLPRFGNVIKILEDGDNYLFVSTGLTEPLAYEDVNR